MMDRKNSVFIVLVAILAICSWSCEKSYKDIVEEELRSGENYDSLFLGISLEMNRKEFYTHCWDLNNKGVVINGPSNLSVEYRLKEELKSPGYMRFYPKFENDLMNKMEIEFGYLDWAPWNQSLQVDSLMYDVTTMMEKWYGNREFMFLEDNEGRKVWVKVDGNRRIRLWVRDVRRVSGDIVDLTKLKDSEK